MNTKQFHLSLCLDVKVDVNNDSSDTQKEYDAKVAFIEWVRTELNIPSLKERGGCKLDISHGYGEVWIYDNEYITAEVM
jgi:hypothetical protein